MPMKAVCLTLPVNLAASGRNSCRVVAGQPPGASVARPMSASALGAAFADLCFVNGTVKRGGRGSGVSEIESTVIYTPESASRIWSPHLVSHYPPPFPVQFLPRSRPSRPM